jgi:hypothetical protein
MVYNFSSFKTLDPPWVAVAAELVVRDIYLEALQLPIGALIGWRRALG